MSLIINAENAIIIKKLYHRIQPRDDFAPLDAQVEASSAFQEFQAIQTILFPYFQSSSASYVVADYKGKKRIPAPHNLDNAIRHCSIEGESDFYQAVADWTFFHQDRYKTKLSFASLYMALTPSSVPFFDDVAKALEFVSELHFPEGMNYEGGISLVESGRIRDLRRACCDVGHRH